MTATEDAIRPARDRASDGRRAPARRVSLNDDRWPDWLAAFAFVLATVVVVAWLVPPLNRFFDRSDDPVSLATVPIVPNLVYAAVLFALGVGLRRRLRSAWWAFVVLLLVLPTIGRVASLAGSDRDVLDAVGLVVAGTLLVLAVIARRQFTARTARRAGLRALLLFVVGVVVVSLVGTWLLTTFANANEVGAGESVANVLLGDLGLVADPGVVAPLWVRVLLNVMGAAVVLGSAAVLFRSPAYTRTLGAADEAAVRTLLRDFGDLDSLGYFATRRDKAVVWDHERPDPGPRRRLVPGRAGRQPGQRQPGRRPRALGRGHRGVASRRPRERVVARGNGGRAPRGRAPSTEAGLTAFEIGDEAILDMRTLLAQRARHEAGAPGSQPAADAAATRRGAPPRRADRGGLRPPAASASPWRGDGGDERGFSMALGRLGDPLDGECVLVEAHDGEGKLRGFLSFVPWGRNGLSLDLMRRDPTADNGLVELMVGLAGGARRRLGRGPGVAELRDVPRGVRPWRGARRRADGPPLAAGAAARQPELAARVALPLERQVPARVAAALHLLRVLLRPAPGRRRRGQRRGLPDHPVDRLDPAPHGGTDAGALEQAGEEYAAAGAPAPSRPSPTVSSEALSAGGCPNRCGYAAPSWTGCGRQGIDPYPVGYPRTHALAEVRAGAGDLPPDTRTGRTRLRRRAGSCSSATAAGSCFAHAPRRLG